MNEIPLKELFQDKKVKNYTKYNDKYLVRRNNVYYTRCNTEQEAKRVVELLKKYDWDKSKIEQIKEEAGIVRLNKNNTTGFYNVSIYPSQQYKRGFTYAYSFMKNKKNTRIKNTSLKQLKHNVIQKGWLWKPLTDDARFIDEYL